MKQFKQLLIKAGNNEIIIWIGQTITISMMVVTFLFIIWKVFIL